MAIKGLSKLVLAPYSANGTTVTYSAPTVQEKMASYDWSVERSNTEALYLDNEEAERDQGQFNTGTLNLTTGDLSDDTSKLILNVKTNTVTVGTNSVEEIVFDDETKGKELGVGVIELHQVNNVDFYRAIWFHRVQFNIPSGSADTKGANISWQTPQISGSIMRSAAYDAQRGVCPWQSHADFDTEADALAYLQSKAA